MPLLEEIVFSPGYNNFARGDTFTHDLVDLGDPPVRSRIMNGSTMVPVRYFCETVLQGTVAYEAETQKITAWVKGHAFVMHLNSPIMTVDGAEVELRQPPIVDEGYALAPLRAFESAVTSITRLPKTQQVSIIPWTNRITSAISSPDRRKKAYPNGQRCEVLGIDGQLLMVGPFTQWL